MKSQKGETLVEAIIALAVAVAIATGIVIAVITALSGASNNQASNFALNYAQEGADLIKDQISNDFTSFTHKTSGINDYPTGVYCLSDEDTSLVVTSDNTDEINYDPSSTICPDSGGPNIAVQNSSYLRKIYMNQSGCDSRKGSCNQVCASGNVFIASVVSWTDAKCTKSNPNCHKTEIDSCVTDLNKITAP